MARGWESKAVEQQQAEALEAASSGARFSPEEAAKARKREGLRLSRQRVAEQLQRAQNPAHQRMLKQALADLDEQLNRLD